jgi:hypothetical protein
MAGLGQPTRATHRRQLVDVDFPEIRVYETLSREFRAYVVQRPNLQAWAILRGKP